MAERVDGLTEDASELARRLERLERRVEALEARRASQPVERTAAVAEPEPVGVPALSQGTLALVGRTLLVLAGAYLVRALTDGRVLPAGVGVALGIAYAALWQLMADREAGVGRAHSAAFHDLASSLIAFPLLWEACARFALLPPAAACAALVAFFGLGLGVAWHRRLGLNAALTTALALATAVALLVSTHAVLPCIAAVLAIAAGLEWLAFRGAWLGLRWMAAAVLDGMALVLLAVATRPELPDGYPPFSSPAAAAALLAVPALYIAGVAARTLRLGQPVTVFEVAQASFAGLLGFGGAVRVLAAHGLPSVGPGAIAAGLGLLCYTAAFAYVERRPGQGRNFYLYSTAGGVLTLAGTSLVGLGAGLALAWVAAGVLAAVLGRRHDRMTLRVHGALFLLAATLQTGLLPECTRSLFGQAQQAVTVPGWASALGAAVAWIVLAADHPGPGLSRAPQLLLASIAVLAAGHGLHLALRGLLGGVLERDPGVATVAGTAVLAGLALALAVGARRGALPELGWLVYPLLVAGGFKLLVQDLRDGRPATLVVSLALYGLVLTLAPRLMKAAPARA